MSKAQALFNLFPNLHVTQDKKEYRVDVYLPAYTEIYLWIFFLYKAIRTYILLHNLFLSFFVFMLCYNLLCHYFLLSHYYFIAITDVGVGTMVSHMLSIYTLKHWATSPMISHPLTVMSIHVSWHGKPFSHGGILICIIEYDFIRCLFAPRCICRRKKVKLWDCNMYC